jgi:hypothetical protein
MSSNVPDDFMQYHCRKCGETPCDCGSDGCYQCGGELDEDGYCPDCDVGVCPDEEDDRE